jgi:hypothetical protein
VTEKVQPKLLLPEALIARRALRHRVAPAVPEEQYPFLAAQVARSLAVEMHDATAADADSIVLPDYLEASRALWVRQLASCLIVRDP